MAITAQQVKELRDRTGVGMSKCKDALHGADGDMELAIANLRKAGMASAVKKEGREAKEGLVATAENAEALVIVEINAETDFVTKNDNFKSFVNNISNEILNTKPESLEIFLANKYSQEPGLTVDEYRATVVQSIGENIQIKRFEYISKDANSSYGIYSHMGGKIVAVVELEGSSEELELVKDIAMQVAAEAPEYLSDKEIPDTVKANEEDIARGQVKGKPENIIAKIIAGKLRAFYNRSCLVCQQFIKDPDHTIATLVEKRSKDTGKSLEIKKFIRWNIGSE